MIGIYPLFMASGFGSGTGVHSGSSGGAHLSKSQFQQLQKKKIKLRITSIDTEFESTIFKLTDIIEENNK